jgi:organic radical activating enzyme
VEQKINFYVSSFDETKKKLDSISPTFCAAKWLQVSLHLTNGRTHSCYHPPTHAIDIIALKNNPSALHNTDQKFKERQMMLSGQRPAGCEYCWKIEDAEHVSDRYYRSSEHWAVDKIDQIADHPFDASINPTYVEVNFNQACNFKCSYCSPHLSSSWEEEIEKFGPYDINGYLHNDVSVLKRINLMPADISRKENPYIQAFWQWWPDIYKDLRVFRMTGGEPLMDSNTFRVLDYVIDHPNKNLELSVTSNMCPPKDIFEKFLNKVKRLDDVEHKVECYVPDPHDGSEWQSWPHYIIGRDQKEYHDSDLSSIERNEIPQTFPEIGHALEDGSFTYLYSYTDHAVKHFSLYVSLDAVGAQAEYIRNGMDYDQLLSNVERFLDETRNTSVTFINTFNLLSITSFKDFLMVILKLRSKYNKQTQKEKYNNAFQRIWFDIPILRSPEWMSIFNANDDQIYRLKEIAKWMRKNNTQNQYNSTLEGFKDFEIEKVCRNINLLEENRFRDEILIKNLNNCRTFFYEHDRRRGTDFKKTFPEIDEWIST